MTKPEANVAESFSARNGRLFLSDGSVQAEAPARPFFDSTERKGFSPVAFLKSPDGYVRAGRGGVAFLYDLHVRDRGRGPYWMNIYEPMPFPTKKAFTGFFSETAEVYALKDGPRVKNFFILHDFQREHRLANVDVTGLEGTLLPGSLETRALRDALEEARRRRRLTRLQSFVLAEDSARVRLLESLGFSREGALREHYFHEGILRDVAILSWNADERRAA